MPEMLGTESGIPACRRPGSPMTGGFSTAPLVDASAVNAQAPMNAVTRVLTLNTKLMPPPRVPREDVCVLLVNEGSAIHRTLGERVAQDLPEHEEILDPSVGWAAVCSVCGRRRFGLPLGSGNPAVGAQNAR